MRYILLKMSYVCVDVILVDSGEAADVRLPGYIMIPLFTGGTDVFQGDEKEDEQGERGSAYTIYTG